MCSLNLYNWYENRFPNDFNQLIQIKHYNISDLSFLLSSIWYKLDHGEKLLMCAVYYDDFNLAKQMINEKLIFRVNPFYSNNYLTQNSCKGPRSSQNTGDNYSYKLESIDTINSSVFSNDSDDNEPKITTYQHRRKSSLKEEKKCWCKNKSYLNRSSMSSINSAIQLDEYENLQNTNDLNTDSDDSEVLSDTDLQTNSTYYFNHNICEDYMQSPFYLAVKLKNYKMCKLFMDNLKASFLTTFNSKLVKNQQIQQLSQQLKQDQHNSSHLINCFKNHRNSSVSSMSTKTSTIHLNSMLSNNELKKLLVLSLSNRSYDISTLILSSVSNPKQIIDFQNLSESFIYNEQFCLYLIKNKIVDCKNLLKESISRHATSTTYLIVNYLESLCVQNDKFNDLFELYKWVLTHSVLIGDLNIFKMLLIKLSKCEFEKVVQSVKIDLTVNSLLTRNYSNVLDSLKTFKISYFIDLEATKTLGNQNKFDLDAFYNLEKFSGIVNGFKSSLSYFNRLKLILFLFNNKPMMSLKCVDSIKTEMDKPWNELMVKFNIKLNNYDQVFAAREYDESLYENFVNEIIPNPNTLHKSKRFYIGKYLVYKESQPFMVKSLLDHYKDGYKITRNDLIQGAKS